MEKLVVVIMGQNCEKFIGMSLESVKSADAIVYCDGGSTDETTNIVAEFLRDKKGDIIENDYDQDDPAMNGKQRNFYLECVKKNYKGYWCLAIDADEVVEDLDKLKEWINKYGEVILARSPCVSVKMRHIIGDLAHEDATVPEHFVLNRLFKIQKDLVYPEVEHSVLQSKKVDMNNICRATTIWHLAYAPNLWDIKKRYVCHMKKSNIHSPGFLKNWYYAHLFGQYPKREFSPIELPSIILNEFGIDKDELYFANRGLENKHWIDASDWKNFFKLDTELAAEFGCGRGPRVHAMNEVGIRCDGYEYSEYAVNNPICKPHLITQMDLTEKYPWSGMYQLSIAYDVLEHIPYEKLDIAIDNLIDSSRKFILISVPFKGTPNCENDPTHIIKEDRAWWVKKFTDKGLKEVEVPEHFLFKEQLLIFEETNTKINIKNSNIKNSVISVNQSGGVTVNNIR